MSVRVRLPAPARRKRHIACDELFHFIAKLIARSFCCSSLPTATRCAGLAVGCRRCAAVLPVVKRISILTVLSTSEQSPLCSDVFLCLWQKRRHPPAPLLLLSKSQPLTLGCDLVLGANPEVVASILFRYSSSSQATYRLRRAFSFHCKAHRARILPLLASNRAPLSLGGGKEKRRLTFCV